MRTICAIDPGPAESAYVVIDAATCLPLRIGKQANDVLIGTLPQADLYAIEMVSSYGMPVGVEVFDTVRWIGRFEQAIIGRPSWWGGEPPMLVYRRDVKLHLCGTARANDANITQALVDRFARGQPNRGKGNKKTPGWFHGFAGDIWQSYALGVYVADRLNGRQP